MAILNNVTEILLSINLIIIIFLLTRKLVKKILKLHNLKIIYAVIFVATFINIMLYNKLCNHITSDNKKFNFDI